MNISALSHFRPHLTEEETTHITAHVSGVFGMFEVRGVSWKPISSRQRAPASISIQTLPGGGRARKPHRHQVTKSTSHTQPRYVFN